MPQTPQTSYGWKQPTPFSSLKENQNLTVFDRLVFYGIWENVRNKDGSYDFRHGNKLYQNIEVKRGEAIFAVDRFAKNIDNDPKHVRRSIEKLEKWYTEMEIERKPFGLLIRFILYDAMVEMEIEKEINSKSIANQSQINSRASKESVLKSVKNEKSEKNVSKVSEPSSQGNEINNLIELFKPINPSYKDLYKNKTQRNSLKEMIDEHGYDEMVRVIEGLPSVVTQPYAPRITTPYDLKKDFGKLLVFISQERGKNANRGIKVAVYNEDE